jgi:hypothetical protein
MERVARSRCPFDVWLPRSAPGQGRAQPGASKPLTRRAAQPRSRARAGGSWAPCPRARQAARTPSCRTDLPLHLRSPSLLGQHRERRSADTRSLARLRPVPDHGLDYWQASQIVADGLSKLAISLFRRCRERAHDFGPTLQSLPPRARRQRRRPLQALLAPKRRLAFPHPLVAMPRPTRGLRRCLGLS